MVQIRSLLKLAVSLALGAVLILGALIWQANLRMEDITQSQSRAQAVAGDVSTLLVLTHEYALYGEERAARQWRGRQAVIVRELGNEPGVTAAPTHSLEQANALLPFFDQLVAAKQAQDDAFQRRRTQILLDQLLTHTQALSDSVQRWSKSTALERKTFEQGFHLFIFSVPVATVILLLLLAQLLRKRLLAPLSRLHAAVQAVAMGDISQRCGTDANDEIGELSRTFDAMAVDLVSQLRGREGLLRQILDTSTVGIFLVDWQGRITHANLCLAEMFGWPVEHLCSLNYLDLVHPSEREESRVNLHALLSSQKSKVELVRAYWRADHREFWGHLSARRFFDANGDDIGVIGVISDVTEQRLADLALKESEERFRSALEHAPIGMALLSPDGRFVQVNQALCDIIGYPADALLKLTLEAITYPEDLQKEVELFRLLEAGHIRFFETEKRYLCRDGRIVWVQVTGTMLRDGQGHPKQIIKQVQDITERKLLEQRLEKQARTDFLTGLANRRHFLEVAERELARVQRFGTPLSLVMLDLDHFKGINDSYGHEAGDKVLQNLAKVCRNQCRELDVVGRLGGEEFAILFPETPAQAAAEVVDRLRLAIAHSAVELGDGKSLHYTASFGLTEFHADDSLVDMLLNRADRALYQAKHQGRNRVCQLVPNPNTAERFKAAG